MHLLADENLPRLAVQTLRSRGHNVLWITEETRGVDDRAVLSRATAEKRILLTLDKDFRELFFRDELKAPFGIILFRIPQEAPDREQTIVALLESRTDWAGHFSVINENGVVSMTPFMPTN